MREEPKWSVRHTVAARELACKSCGVLFAWHLAESRSLARCPVCHFSGTEGDGGVELDGITFRRILDDREAFEARAAAGPWQAPRRSRARTYPCSECPDGPCEPTCLEVTSLHE